MLKIYPMKNPSFLHQNKTPNSDIEKINGGWRLKIQRGDASQYRDAQLDDYSRLPRRKFPRHSVTMSLRARASSASIPGTWGFGLWNDPFGLSLGFGGNPFRLPALPNAVWFFHASPQNYLSFRDDKPAQGFLAQSFRSPAFHPLLMMAGIALPFSKKITRKLLSKVIKEDSANLNMDVTKWHTYKFTWNKNHVAFWVDDICALESAVSPKSPLGIIIWLDNQYAAFTPDGKIAAGILSNEKNWLEITDLKIQDD